MALTPHSAPLRAGVFAVRAGVFAVRVGAFAVRVGVFAVPRTVFLPCVLALLPCVLVFLPCVLVTVGGSCDSWGAFSFYRAHRVVTALMAEALLVTHASS